MLTFNEGKVCEAIIRHLEEREQSKRNDVFSPEASNHDHPVELVFKLKNQLFAIEHTGIEPFDGHMRLEAEAHRNFEPIQRALTGVLSHDIVEIHVPAKAMFDLRKSEVGRIQLAIISWVRQSLEALKTRSYGDYVGDIQWRAIEGVPFEIRLFRFENLTSQPGWVKIVHAVTGNREKQRAERLGRSCDKKFPKLAAWKRNHTARTVLILEENDIQLTNHAVVAESYLSLALPREDRPDETYLVATCLEPWSVWPILLGERSLYDLAVDDYVPRWEVDPATLISATDK